MKSNPQKSSPNFTTYQFLDDMECAGMSPYHGLVKHLLEWVHVNVPSHNIMCFICKMRKWLLLAEKVVAL